MIPRRRLHRATFALAAIYNVAWSVHATLDPQAFFRFAGLPPLNHPAIYQCLAMVIGLYGVLYAEVARVPERGFILGAVGLAGKVLGPIGLAVLVVSGTWPARTVALVIPNDLIWWIPFGLYVRDAWPSWRAEWGARSSS
jgi:hypothetical protein